MQNNIVIYQETDLSARTHIRAGEHKLGEKLLVMKPGEGLGNLKHYKIQDIELDMDSIVNMPSSAMTPSGFTVEEARKFMRMMAANLTCAYVHLPEGVHPQAIPMRLSRSAKHWPT